MDFLAGENVSVDKFKDWELLMVISDLKIINRALFRLRAEPELCLYILLCNWIT